MKTVAILSAVVALIWGVGAVILAREGQPGMALIYAVVGVGYIVVARMYAAIKRKDL